LRIEDQLLIEAREGKSSGPVTREEEREKVQFSVLRKLVNHASSAWKVAPWIVGPKQPKEFHSGCIQPSVAANIKKMHPLMHIPCTEPA
jgi:hypothetical protein